MVLSTAVIADVHAMFVDMMKVVLEGQFSVVGTASNGHELIESIRRCHPKSCLCDIAMQKLNGLEALRQCGEARLSTRFIMVTGSKDILLAIKAFQLGAFGYLLKTQSIAETLIAIKQVASGKTYVCPSIADRVFNNMMFPSREAQRDSCCLPHLTIREAQVLQLLAEGSAIKEIAGQLDVSSRTIAFHKNNICDKLGLRSVAELTRFALGHGFAFD